MKPTSHAAATPKCRRLRAWCAIITFACVALNACTGQADEDQSDPSPPEMALTLREAAAPRLRVGTAIGGATTSEALADPSYRHIAAEEFSLFTPENQMKWRIIHPQRGRYDFGPADEVANFARSAGAKMRGHTFIWHGGNPDWIEQLSCDALRVELRAHIRQVMTRYKSDVIEWDIANEVIDDSGKLRMQENPFLRACGVGILVDAFRWARDTAPEAELFINDYGIEGVGQKSDAYVALISQLRGQGVPIDGIGFQAHILGRDGVPPSFQDNLRRFEGMGLKVAITEADVRLPLDAADQSTDSDVRRQGEIYAELATACRRLHSCQSFTVWGFSDRYHWAKSVNPQLGNACLFDANLRPKRFFSTFRKAISTNL